MINHNSYEYGRREYQRSREENASLTLVLLVLALFGVGFYLLVSRFRVRTCQIAELSLYLTALIAALISIVCHARNRKSRMEQTWPHPALLIPQLRDDAYVQRAFAQRAIVPGYDIHARPWYWSDEARRMQTIVIGQTGYGKTN